MEKRLKEIKKSLSSTFNLSYFLQLTDFLTELVSKEMANLKMVRIHELEVMEPIKREAYELYAQMIRSFRKDPELLNSLLPDERNILKQVTESLSKLLERNERMISAFNEANRKVIEIFNHVTISRMGNQYGPKGRKRPPHSGFSNFSQSG